MKNVKPGRKAPVVALDAGHYGKYNRGVVSAYYESEAMWTLHNLLATELEAYGIQVIKTRQVQALDMDLVTRGRKAQGADLFLSLHSNACDTERVDRPEAIYLWDDNCGAIDEASKEIAGLLAETVRKIMDTKDPARTFTRKAGHDRDRDGLKNDDYYGVLFGCHQVAAPGVILEHSFHTNRRACEWLMHDANLRTLAKAEAKTIAAWFDVEKPAATTGSSSSTSAPAKSVKATKAAASGPVASLRGTYKVTAKKLNVRHGAGAEKDKDGKDKHAIMVAIPEGTKVECWGYYSTAANGVKWPYIQFTYQGVKYTGFASINYLEKV